MSRAVGDIAEERAAKYLIKNGYEILERNFYSKFGEIDIIAKKGKVLHFIEVKSGKNFEPIYAITPKKVEKIIKTINYYLLKKRLNCNYCIDAIIIKNQSVEMVENITI